MIKEMKKIWFAIVLSLLLFSNASASEVNNSINEHSLYSYNALESKVSFVNLGSNTSDWIEKSSKNNGPTSSELLNDVTKELQEMTEKQNSLFEKTENAMNALKNRSGLRTFLMGNSLGILRFQLVHIEDQIHLLAVLAPKTEDNMIKIKIDNQVKLLKEKQVTVGDFILEQEKEFSLFGWLVNSL